MIIDRLVIYGLLASLVACGIWGIAHGESRYADGVAAERSHWEGEIALANDRIKALESKDSGNHAVGEAAARAAVAELSAIPLGSVSDDVAKAASYPAEILAALNAIKVRR